MYVTGPRLSCWGTDVTSKLSQKKILILQSLCGLDGYDVTTLSEPIEIERCSILKIVILHACIEAMLFVLRKVEAVSTPAWTTVRFCMCERTGNYYRYPGCNCERPALPLYAGNHFGNTCFSSALPRDGATAGKKTKAVFFGPWCFFLSFFVYCFRFISLFLFVIIFFELSSILLFYFSSFVFLFPSFLLCLILSPFPLFSISFSSLSLSLPVSFSRFRSPLSFFPLPLSVRVLAPTFRISAASQCNYTLRLPPQPLCTQAFNFWETRPQLIQIRMQPVFAAAKIRLWQGRSSGLCIDCTQVRRWLPASSAQHSFVACIYTRLT